MSTKDYTPKIHLPKGWPDTVKSAMLHIISLAQFGMAYTHGWAANSINSRIRKPSVNGLSNRSPN